MRYDLSDCGRNWCGRFIVTALLMLFAFAGKGTAADTTQADIRGLLKDGKLEKCTADQGDLPTIMYFLSDPANYKSMGYGSEKEYMRDRAKIITALQVYAKFHDASVSGTSDENRDKWAKQARGILKRYDIDPKAKHGRWDFEGKAKDLLKANDIDLKRVRQLEEISGNRKLKDFEINDLENRMKRIALRQEEMTQLTEIAKQTDWTPLTPTADQQKVYQDALDTLDRLLALEQEAAGIDTAADMTAKWAELDKKTEEVKANWKTLDKDLNNLTASALSAARGDAGKEWTEYYGDLPDLAAEAKADRQESVQLAYAIMDNAAELARELQDDTQALAAENNQLDTAEDLQDETADDTAGESSGGSGGGGSAAVEFEGWASTGLYGSNRLLAFNIYGNAPEGGLSGGTLDAYSRTESGDRLWADTLALSDTDPSASYTGTKGQKAFSRALWSSDLGNFFSQSETLNGFYEYDNKGEFLMYKVPRQTFNIGGNTNSFSELGFTGVYATSLPNTGIATYEGHALLHAGGDPNDPTRYSESGDFTLYANFKSGKAIGYYTKASGTDWADAMWVYGTIDPSTCAITGARVIGFAGQREAAFTGTTEAAFGGEFYGSANQGVALSLAGNFHDNGQAANDEGFWGIAGGFKNNGKSSGSSPAGTAAFSGFATGMLEDTVTGDSYAVRNADGADFTLSLDRVNGTVTGAITLDEPDGGTHHLDAVGIGGAHGSAYVADNIFVAELGGSNVARTGGSTGDLNPNGKILHTAPAAEQFATYAQWGQWAEYHQDPQTGNAVLVDYINKGGLWIAGEKTDTAAVQNLIDTHFTGTYTGGARGVEFVNATKDVNYLSGTSNIAVDFGAQSFTGTLDFGSVNMTVAGGGGSVTTGGFTGAVTNVSTGAVATSGVDGAFYGPNAESLGGNFHATLGNGNKYTGVFGGDR